MNPAMNPKELIQAELSERIGKNPRYSLRAFSRSSGISHTVLSLFLSGKRPLSKKATLRLAEHLGLDPAQKARLLASRKPGTPSLAAAEYRELPLDVFTAIADWQHYAILSALELPKARLEARWIARRLGIPELQAKLSIERLKRLELVGKTAEGRWRQSGKPLKMENVESTAATRRFHRQLLDKAQASLENDPAELRDFSSITLAMDPELVPYAKERIRAFRRELAAELEARSAREESSARQDRSADARSPREAEVYHLSVQVFPLSSSKRKSSNTKES
ncbi:MAG: DUF4423 domain-containing protein [Oligoflexia bacterium]|nr:DUF4423 domain-containing protein [Oligoflexia bacterium]